MRPVRFFYQDFNRLWSAQLISALGSGFGALGLLALLQLNATPAQIGLLETARALPMLLFSLFAGVWVDRLAKRPLLIFSDLGRFLLLLLVAIAAFFHLLPLTVLYGVAFVVGTLTILFHIAYHAYVPHLVEAEALVSANSKLSAGDAVIEIGAPSLGGLLVQLLGAPLTVLVDAFTFLGSAFFLTRINRVEAPRATEPDQAVTTIWHDIWEGLRFVLHQPLLRPLLLASAAIDFFGGFFAANYSFFVIRHLGLSPFWLGLFVGAGGIGALGGAFIAERLSRWLGVGRLLGVAIFCSGLLGLLTPFSSGKPLLLVIIFMIAAQLGGDIFRAIYEIVQTTTRQLVAHNHILGRVNASFGFFTGGIGMVGILAGGLLGERMGSTVALTVACGGFMVAGLGLLTTMGHNASHNLQE